jgi:hypothetical protein
MHTFLTGRINQLTCINLFAQIHQSIDITLYPKMTKVSAADISKLRELTGAGMMDCKKALEESNGDTEAAKTGFVKKASPKPLNAKTAKPKKAW